MIPAGAMSVAPGDAVNDPVLTANTGPLESRNCDSTTWTERPAFTVAPTALTVPDPGDAPR